MEEENWPSDVLDVLNQDLEPNCFNTGFNEPWNLGFSYVASTNPSDPLTLSQDTKRSDWFK